MDQLDQRNSIQRLTWMDTIRGGAILLVIVGHATYMGAARGYGTPEILADFNQALAPFRIPALVFLSGMLVDRSLAKGLSRYATGKLRAIAWPYVLWTILVLVVLGDPHPERALGMLWISPTYLWYLLVLLVSYLLIVPLQRVPPLLTMSIALVGSMFVPVNEFRLERVLYLFALFVAGRWLWERRDRVLPALRRWWVIALALIPATAASLVVLNTSTSQYEAFMAPLALSGIAAIVGICQRLPDALTSPLRAVGRQSIVYYVTHWIVMILAVRWTNPLIGHTFVTAFLTSVTAAIVVAAILAWASRHLKPVQWLFRI